MPNLWQILGLLLFLLAAGRLVLALRGWWQARRAQAAELQASLAALDQHLSQASLPVTDASPHRPGWQGFRSFRVRRKAHENANVCSFYIEPQDGRPLAPYLPGQYLTFQLEVPGQKRPVVRCYSLSDAPRRDYYRVSIKRLAAPATPPNLPPGIGSNHFHDQVKEGDLLAVKAPNGDFYLDLSSAWPVVLIAGGIGLTPLLSMANALQARPGQRETWLILGLRNLADLLFTEQLQRLSRIPGMRVCLAFSQVPADDAAWQALASDSILLADYLAGTRQPPCKLILATGERVSLPLLQRLLPAPTPWHYYLCGPGPMMASLTEGLPAWGVPPEAIHLEAFGPASNPRKAGQLAASSAPAVSWRVEFAQSHQTVTWDGSSDNLLDLARQHGIQVDCGCRIGNCGTCVVGLKAGRVRYGTAPSATIAADHCLACVAVPESDLVLDA